MKNLIIISAYINTQEKEDVLFQALTQLKKLELPILIMCNSILNDRILKLCDYHIYDKENFLLPPERSPINWFADSTETVHLYNKGVGYPIIKKLNIALHFAKNLGFENFLLAEYDNIYHDEDLPKVTNMFANLPEKKGFFCRVYDHGLWLETRIFAGNVDFFLENIPMPLTYEQWNTTPPYSFSSETIEYIFPLLFEKHLDKLDYFDGYNKEYFSKSRIDIFSITQEINMVYNTETPSKPLLFLVGSGNEYRVYLNGALFDTVHLQIGETKKYYLELTDADLEVKVIRPMMEKSFIINNSTIEQYKLVACRYKL